MDIQRTGMRQAQFTRPANTTTYGAGDAMGAGSDSGDCVMEFPAPNPQAQRTGKIMSARLWKSGTGVTADTFRILLFQRSPSQDPDDNGAPTTSWIKEADAGAYIGSIDFETAAVGADANHYEGQDYVPSSGVPYQLSDEGGQIYGILTALDVYAPASGEVFTVTLETQE